MGRGVLRKGAEVFFQHPVDCQRRLLHRCELESIREALHMLRFAEPHPAIEEGSEAFLYFERARQFMQQPLRIALVPADDLCRLGVELRGDAVSAETRQSYRVSALASDVSATLAGEAGCEVLDVSATGFALHASGRHKAGQTLPAVLHYDGKTYAGDVTVQSAKQLSLRKTRYGVHCIGDGSPLAKSLSQINLAIQREQLRRISGSE